jgi:hypothetical protein
MKTNHTVRHITPEKAQSILSEHGVRISLDKAAMALDFLYKMANLEIEQIKQK